MVSEGDRTPKIKPKYVLSFKNEGTTFSRKTSTFHKKIIKVTPKATPKGTRNETEGQRRKKEEKGGKREKEEGQTGGGRQKVTHARTSN